MATLSPYSPLCFTDDADLEAIATLQTFCSTIDQLDQGISAAELKEYYADPDFDITQDLRLWRDGRGDLRAVAELWRSPSLQTIQARLSFQVHPEARQQHLEDEIVRWAEQRLRQAAQGQSLPLELHVGCRDTRQERITLYERHGFAPVRYFFQMQRSLTDPLPEPIFPAGFTLRQVDVQAEAEAWVEMFNHSFVDHWNHHPMTLADFHYYASLSNYDPSLDLVAVAADGTLASFCYGHIYPADNARSGRLEGWINLLGTRRGYRQRGLARAMLLTGLHRLAAQGMAIALLGVDVDNPSGALRLYQSVGFEAVKRSIVFSKAVSGCLKR